MQVFFIKNIKNFFLYSLFFFLPLIHSRFFNTFFWGFDIAINGNFEFTKSIFFIIVSSIIIVLNIKREKKKMDIFSLFFILILLISSIFSISPFASFFWNIEKWHSFFLFFNLVILYNFFCSLDEKERENILKVILFWSFFVALFGIKEFFAPSFHYGDYLGRAIGTFWNPHYFASYILMLSPFFFKIILQEKRYYYSLLFIPLVFCLFLTKSFIGIFIFFFLIFYLFFYKNKWIIISGICLSILAFLFIFLVFPEKIHSLLSRFFIWETVIKIISSDFKIFFLWGWNETLSFMFWNFKSPFLYIFENFWYNADRSHNIFLDFFYNFWIWWFLFLSFIFWFIIKTATNFRKSQKQEVRGRKIFAIWAYWWVSEWAINFSDEEIHSFSNFLTKNFKRNPYIESLLIFFFFHFFNFPSISSYLLFIFFLSSIRQEKGWLKSIFENLAIWKGIWVCKDKNLLLKIKSLFKKTRGKSFLNFHFSLSKIFIIFYSLFSIFLFSSFFTAEHFFYEKQYKKAISYFSHPNYFYELNLFERWKTIENFLSSNYFRKKILNLRNYEENCREFLVLYTSAEDYFYCWNIAEKKWNLKKAKIYYQEWLKKIPNLRENYSPYWNNFFVKNLITGNRFFSEKYSDIKNILDKF
jgi:hypothetical protein